MEMISIIKRKLGVLRSIAIYYWKPFNKQRLIRFYRPFVREGSLCFDIGSHLGNRANAWHALGAKTIALEPQPQCMQYLKKRFQHKENIVLVEKAVGKELGTANLYISELTPTISTLADEGWRKAMNEATSFEVTWDETVAVSVVTLDSLVEEYGLPDFCKIDVEDFEVQVLQGLSYAIPVLSFEYFNPTLYRVFECMDLLDALGEYEYNWSFGESQQFNSLNWLSSAEMRAIFKNYTTADRSGDVYARLR